MVKEAIREAGGIPFEFNTIGVDDGIVMGHEGMHYSLPSRELIADSVETMVRAHCFDAMICIPNCDKIVPGMLMGAARANIPTIFVSGGPMAAGVDRGGKKIDLISVFEGVGARAGRHDRRRAARRSSRSHGCPTCGSCSGMFTANSMNCLCEALGIALPGNGTILATSPERHELAAARRASISCSCVRESISLPRHRHAARDRQRRRARRRDGRLHQHGAARARARPRGGSRLSAGALQRGRRARAASRQGLAGVGRRPAVAYPGCPRRRRHSRASSRSSRASRARCILDALDGHRRDGRREPSTGVTNREPRVHPPDRQTRIRERGALVRAVRQSRARRRGDQGRRGRRSTR